MPGFFTLETTMRITIISSCFAGLGTDVLNAGQTYEVSDRIGRELISLGRARPAPEAPAPEAPAPTFAPVDMSEPRGGRRRRKD
jgi:hypothetical protein